VRLCAAPNGEEVFILCRSMERQAKEQAIHERFERRIEEGLEKIAASCRSRKRKPFVMAARVGKLMGQNTCAAGLFQVRVKEVGGSARIAWCKQQSWREWARLEAVLIKSAGFLEYSCSTVNLGAGYLYDRAVIRPHGTKSAEKSLMLGIKSGHFLVHREGTPTLWRARSATLLPRSRGILKERRGGLCRDCC